VYLYTKYHTPVWNRPASICSKRKVNVGFMEPVYVILNYKERGGAASSVSIGSDYGLDDRAIGVRSPAEGKVFSSSHCIQTSTEAHPTCSPTGTGCPFSGAKARPGVTLTTHPHLVSRSRKRSYTSSPPKHLHDLQWDTFSFSYRKGP
jgi:hypothetical protein